LEKHLFIPMTAEQQAHHDENKYVVARIVARWKRSGFLSESDQRRLMIALQYMRMSCNSTYLLDQETEFGTKPDELIAQLEDVLEQRIGRVHRLGQQRPVHVLHFVSQGSIEHGMLDLLKFKKSLFAGVLDGGQDQVFMGGSRLKKFMDSVEKATGAIPEAALEP